MVPAAAEAGVGRCDRALTSAPAATSARMIGLDPAQLPYLKDAGRFLGHLDAHRIELRGEAFARFATQFDVIDRFKSIRLSPS